MTELLNYYYYIIEYLIDWFDFQDVRYIVAIFIKYVFIIILFI